MLVNSDFWGSKSKTGIGYHGAEVCWEDCRCPALLVVLTSYGCISFPKLWMKIYRGLTTASRLFILKLYFDSITFFSESHGNHCEDTSGAVLANRKGNLQQDVLLLKGAMCIQWMYGHFWKVHLHYALWKRWWLELIATFRYTKNILHFIRLQSLLFFLLLLSGFFVFLILWTVPLEGN